MSISITSTPRVINPIGNPYWIVASSSNAGNQYNFRYNYDIKVNGELVFTKKVTSNPYNQLPEIKPLNGESDVNSVIRDVFDEQYLPQLATQSGITYSTDNFYTTLVEVKEVYSSNINSTPSPQTQSATQSFFSINTYLSQDDYWAFENQDFSLYIADNQTVQLKSRILTDRSSSSQLANYNILSFINFGSTPYTAIFDTEARYFSDVFINDDGSGGEDRFWIDQGEYAQLDIPEVLGNFTSDILIVDEWTTPGNWVKWRKDTEFTTLEFFIYMDNPNFTFINGELRFLGYRNGSWEVLSISTGETMVFDNGLYEFQVSMDTVPLTLQYDYEKFGLQIYEGATTQPSKFFVYENLNQEGRKHYSINLIAQTNENLFVIRGYKEPSTGFPSTDNQNWVDGYFTGSGENMRRLIMTDYYRQIDVDFYDINITPNTILPTEPFSLSNNLRLYNKCNSVYELEEVTLIWMNTYGEWDTFTFMKLGEQVVTQKTGIQKDFNSRLATRQTQNYSSISRNDVLSFDIVSRNLSIIEYNYLYNILLSKDVYWLKKDPTLDLGQELVSIVVQTNEIISKPINNIYKQMQLNVRLSQKLKNY